MSYVVMAYNSNGVVTALGTVKRGNPFQSKTGAEKMERKVQRLYPNLRTMILPIETGPA